MEDISDLLIKRYYEWNGMEIKADAASGIVLDIGAILKPRVEINWEKELKR